MSLLHMIIKEFESRKSIKVGCSFEIFFLIFVASQRAKLVPTVSHFDTPENEVD